MTTPRPPRKSLVEAAKVLEEEIKLREELAVRAQATADDPPYGVDGTYWQRVATAATRKAERLGVVAAWLGSGVQ